jgi:hypothetical protein
MHPDSQSCQQALSPCSDATRQAIESNKDNKSTLGQMKWEAAALSEMHTVLSTTSSMFVEWLIATSDRYFNKQYMFYNNCLWSGDKMENTSFCDHLTRLSMSNAQQRRIKTESSPLFPDCLERIHRVALSAGPSGKEDQLSLKVQLCVSKMFLRTRRLKS